MHCTTPLLMMSMHGLALPRLRVLADLARLSVTAQAPPGGATGLLQTVSVQIRADVSACDFVVAHLGTQDGIPPSLPPAPMASSSRLALHHLLAVAFLSSCVAGKMPARILSHWSQGLLDVLVSDLLVLQCGCVVTQVDHLGLFAELLVHTLTSNFSFTSSLYRPPCRSWHCAADPAASSCELNAERHFDTAVLTSPFASRRGHTSSQPSRTPLHPRSRSR
mmetsp:Transcript_62529/g.202684  ORF Transcript_62529/g.202684 Transcript_62529/m.202684 type:complete len:221 (+) Transcript_62529:1076-1738(+)